MRTTLFIPLPLRPSSSSVLFGGRGRVEAQSSASTPAASADAGAASWEPPIGAGQAGDITQTSPRTPQDANTAGDDRRSCVRWPGNVGAGWRSADCGRRGAWRMTGHRSSSRKMPPAGRAVVRATVLPKTDKRSLREGGPPRRPGKTRQDRSSTRPGSSFVATSLGFAIRDRARCHGWDDDESHVSARASENEQQAR